MTKGPSAADLADEVARAERGRRGPWWSALSRAAPAWFDGPRFAGMRRVARRHRYRRLLKKDTQACEHARESDAPT